ncbi:MAG TPA: hypothetical protein DC042_06745 [Bacteroidales bacterium]|nr:hypothetical protein [Bacteroidales bacterium]
MRGFGQAGETAVISVHDINGKQLLPETQSATGNDLFISLKSLPSGIFFIKVLEGKNSGTVKILKH